VPAAAEEVTARRPRPQTDAEEGALDGWRWRCAP